MIQSLILPGILILIAGMADGLNQVLQFRYHKFALKFPKLNGWFFNPLISWNAKYKNNDPAQGAKFPGSTTIFVFVTDAYHLTRFLSNLFTFSSIALLINSGLDYSLLKCCLMALGLWGINRVGFSIIWKLF